MKIVIEPTPEEERALTLLGMDFLQWVMQVSRRKLTEVMLMAKSKATENITLIELETIIGEAP